MLHAALRITFVLVLAGPVSGACAQAPSGAAHEPQLQEPQQQEPVSLFPRYLLMNPQGRAVTNEDFRGRFQLIAFGFVSCPDVCPTTLLEFKHILEALGDQALQLQPIFITVDPERDTGEILREYTAAFDPRILGLTGSVALVRRAAETFRVEFEKVREPGATLGVYTMNHTAGMVLLDPQGSFVARFAYAMPAKDIALRIREALGGGER